MQLADEGLANASGFVGDGTQHELDRGVAHPVGESVEVSETLGCDLDLVGVDG